MSCAAGWKSSESFELSSILSWIAVVGQSLCLGLAIVRMHRATSTARVKRGRVLLCMGMLVVSTMLRAMWFTIAACKKHESTIYADFVALSFLIRLSDLFDFTGFMMYLQTWAQFLHTATRFLPELRRLLTRFAAAPTSIRDRQMTKWTVIVSVIVWTASLGLNTIDAAFGHAGRPGGGCRVCYDTGILIIAGMALVVSGALAILGALLASSIASVNEGEMVARTDQIFAAASVRVRIVATICCAVYLIRFIMYSYRPMTGKLFPDWVYPWLFSTISLISTSTLIISTTVAQKRKHLLRQDESVRFESMVVVEATPEFLAEYKRHCQLDQTPEGGSASTGYRAPDPSLLSPEGKG